MDKSASTIKKLILQTLLHHSSSSALRQYSILNAFKCVLLGKDYDDNGSIEKSWSKQLDDGLQFTILLLRPPIDNQLTLIAGAVTVVVTAGLQRETKKSKVNFSQNLGKVFLPTSMSRDSMLPKDSKIFSRSKSPKNCCLPYAFGTGNDQPIHWTLCVFVQKKKLCTIFWKHPVVCFIRRIVCVNNCFQYLSF